MRYTQQQKNDALKLAEKIGAKKASEQLSISYQSLLAWRKQKEELAASVESMPVVTQKDKVSDKSDQPLELQVQVLRHEVVQLKKQLQKQSNAIQALARVDEQVTGIPLCHLKTQPIMSSSAFSLDDFSLLIKSDMENAPKQTRV